MKKVILILILAILLLNPVIAKTIEKELYEGNNIEVPGYNITLLVIGDNEKSIVTCINNEIYVIDRESKKTIGNLKIEPTKIYEEYTKLQITYSIDDICDESCSNNVCFGIVSSQKEKNETIKNQEQQINEQENIQKIDNTNLISISLFLLTLILLIILLIKKRGK